MSKKEFISQLSLVLIGVTLLRFWREGMLTSYIHPSTVWVVVVAAIVLLVIALFRIPKIHSHATWAQTTAIIVIALLVVFIRNVPLSVSLAAGRQITGQTLLSSRAQVNIDEPTTDYTEADWVEAWSQSPDHTSLIGQPARVQGFVLTQNGQTYVFRMLITCCIVDAQPIAVAFESPKKAPKDGDWVEVDGNMSQKNSNPLIQATSVKVVTQPTNPYLY